MPREKKKKKKKTKPLIIGRTQLEDNSEMTCLKFKLKTKKEIEKSIQLIKYLLN